MAGRADRHYTARLHPVRLQARGNPVGPRIEGAVIQTRPTAADRIMIRPRNGLQGDQVREGSELALDIGLDGRHGTITG